MSLNADIPPELLRARIRAYELIELAQIEPADDEVTAWLEVASRNRWPEVEFLLHYARKAAASDAGRDWMRHVDRMAEAAERSGNDALVACALATRATMPPSPEHPDELAAERGLARAVALLDDGGGDAADRPMAYSACGLAHHVRGRWELALELYDRAMHALRAPLEPGLERIAELNRRVIVLNRLESVAPLACSLAEVGLREQARDVAAHRTRLSPEEFAALPTAWADETRALEYLLAVLAQEQEPLHAEDHLGRLHPTQRPRYRASIHLGQAVRAVDRGDVATAAALAEIALLHEDAEFVAGIRPYMLSLTTLAGPPAHAWRRYAETVVGLRWQAHLTDVEAARAQIQLARVVLENQRLSERAYVDELTGLANRHAYARYLSRLRHEGPDDQVAVFMVDVDRFKAVNDTYGHGVGDEVLRRVASVLVDLTRPADLAVRLGGDEFLVFLVSAGTMDMLRRGEEMVAAVAARDWSDLAPGLSITVSAGLAAGPSRDVDRLLQEADGHLYAAKSAGRGRLVHLHHG